MWRRPSPPKAERLGRARGPPPHPHVCSAYAMQTFSPGTRDKGHSHVPGVKLVASASELQLLHRETSFPKHHDDVARSRRDGSTDNQGVAEMDSELHHRRTRVSFDEERGHGVAHAPAVEAQRWSSICTRGR